ncbi:STAS/SEC14 domain-containing protein [Caenimonas terrae]|uniref:STAS/SEC14 domain-containing protein n=1 Tax=Caenimonas terrae TaxID=696074 RepID=A0ABW0NKC1_9BURK
MAFSTQLTRFPGYVRVQAAGPNSIGDCVELISMIARETVYWSDRRVVVDLRQVDGELTPTEQIFIGELVAQDLAHLERVASVVPPRSLTRNSERAAQELGSQLRVFDDESQALAWIAAAELPFRKP